MNPSISNPVGFWKRVLAYFIDNLVIAFASIIIGLVIPPIADSLSYTLSAVMFMLIPMQWKGYTVGKKMLGIRIVRIDGKPLTLWTMAKRYLTNLLYAITILILAIVSMFMMGIRKDKRSIHDLIAGTYVTSDLP